MPNAAQVNIMDAVWVIVYLHLSICLVFLPVTDAGFLVNNRPVKCNSTVEVRPSTNYTITATSNITQTVCSLAISSQITRLCRGICFHLQNGSVVNTTQVDLRVVSGNASQNYNSTHTPLGLTCTDESRISVSLVESANNVLGRLSPNYSLALAVYSQCHRRRSISYEEALQYIDGYQHGDKFDENIAHNRLYGMLAGASLAAVFLVILIVTKVQSLISSGARPRSIIRIPQVFSVKKKAKAVSASIHVRRGSDSQVMLNI